MTPILAGDIIGTRRHFTSVVQPFKQIQVRSNANDSQTLSRQRCHTPPSEDNTVNLRRVRDRRVKILGSHSNRGNLCVFYWVMHVPPLGGRRVVRYQVTGSQSSFTKLKSSLQRPSSRMYVRIPTIVTYDIHPPSRLCIGRFMKHGRCVQSVGNTAAISARMVSGM